jgi:hypothetical protein
MKKERGMREVTQWFRVGYNPNRKGLYEVSFKHPYTEHEMHCGLVLFDGKEWRPRKSSWIPSSSCGDQWRGLADKPE